MEDGVVAGFGAFAVIFGVPMVYWFAIRPFYLRFKTGKWPSCDLGDPL